MRLRLVGLAAAAAVASLATAGSAAPAPKPQIVDPAGDAIVPEASLDIVSALFTTDKPGKQPKKLVITVTYSAVPNDSELASHVVAFELPGCGQILMQRYYDGVTSGTYGSSDCLEEAFDVAIAVKDNSLIYTVPFSAVGGSLKPGVVLSDLHAWSGGAEPVVGVDPGFEDRRLVADSASTTATYKVK